MLGSERIKQQLSQLKDVVQEQNRLELLDLEPSEQEIKDICYLLNSIKQGFNASPNDFHSHTLQAYSQLLEELKSLPIDVEQYQLANVSDSSNHGESRDGQEGKSRTKTTNTTRTKVSSGPLQEPLSPHHSNVAGSVNSVISATSANTVNSVNSVNSANSATSLNSVNSLNSVKKKVRFSEPYRDIPDNEQQSAPQTFQDQGDVVYATYDGNQEMILDQDRRLDLLSQSVGRQRQQAFDINEEIDGHINLLDDLEAQTDRSQGRLDQARTRVEHFNRKAREGGHCLIILVLTLTLIILLIL